MSVHGSLSRVAKHGARPGFASFTVGARRDGMITCADERIIPPPTAETAVPHTHTKTELPKLDLAAHSDRALEAARLSSGMRFNV